MKMVKTLGRLLLACALLTVMPGRKAHAADTVTFNFNSVSTGTPMQLINGESFTYTVISSFIGTLQLQKSYDQNSWSLVTSTVNNSGTWSATVAADLGSHSNVYYRFSMTSYTSGTASTTLAGFNDLIFDRANLRGESVYRVEANDFYSVKPLVINPVTTIQMQTLVPKATGQLVINISDLEMCISSGVTAGAWVHPSTSTTAGMRPCYQ